MNRFIKAAHIMFACLWLGASSSIVVLQCLRGWPEDARELAALNLDFALLDVTLIIPGAVGSLVTGFFICKTTSWRFIRYRWVIVKWIGGLFGILVGTALLSPWQIQLVNLSGELENMPVIGGPYDLIRLPFVMIGFLQVYLLLSMIVVSVLKPWGKRIPRQEQARSFAKRSLSPWKSLWAKMDFSNDRR